MGCGGSIEKEQEKKEESEKVKTIILCGLDNAGKTTLLNRLENHVKTCDNPLATEVPEADNLSSIATVGVDDVTIILENTKYKIIDVSGQDVFRVHWKTFLQKQPDIIFFVVDSSAPARFEEAKKTLEEHILTNDAVKNCPLLIICTKNDLPTTVSPDELVHQIVDKKFLTLTYQFLTTSSKTGEGLREILGFFKLKAK